MTYLGVRRRRSSLRVGAVIIANKHAPMRALLPYHARRRNFAALQVRFSTSSCSKPLCCSRVVVSESPDRGTASYTI